MKWQCCECGAVAILNNKPRSVFCKCGFIDKDPQFTDFQEEDNSVRYDVCFTWPFFSRIGGVETWHKTLLKELGLKSYLVTPKKSTCDVSKIHKDNSYGSHETRQAILKSNVTIASAIESVERFLPAKNRRRIIYVDHGDGSIEYFSQLFHWNKHVADTFVCVNEEVAERYREHHKDVRYIPNGIDPSRIASKRHKTKTKYVVWVHRKSEEKRPELAHKIGEALPEGWKLVMTCEGQSTDKVKYIGIVHNPRHLYSIASAFLSTSNSDGFGLSCAEAMMSGVPVVSSPIGICQDSRLATQVDLKAPPSEWVEAILKSQEFNTARTKEIVEEKYGIEKFVDSWRKLILEPFERSERNTKESSSDFYESCIHRGEKFGVMDCNCAGNLNVHKCNLHELCCTRKLRSGTPNIMTDAGVVNKEVKYCNSCSDFKAKE